MSCICYSDPSLFPAQTHHLALRPSSAQIASRNLGPGAIHTRSARQMLHGSPGPHIRLESQGPAIVEQAKSILDWVQVSDIPSIWNQEDAFAKIIWVITRHTNDGMPIFIAHRLAHATILTFLSLRCGRYGLSTAEGCSRQKFIGTNNTQPAEWSALLMAFGTIWLDAYEAEQPLGHSIVHSAALEDAHDILHNDVLWEVLFSAACLCTIGTNKQTHHVALWHDAQRGPKYAAPHVEYPGWRGAANPTLHFPEQFDDWWKLLGFLSNGEWPTVLKFSRNWTSSEVLAIKQGRRARGQFMQFGPVAPTHIVADLRWMLPNDPYARQGIPLHDSQPCGRSNQPVRGLGCCCAALPNRNSKGGKYLKFDRSFCHVPCAFCTHTSIRGLTYDSTTLTVLQDTSDGSGQCLPLQEAASCLKCAPFAGAINRRGRYHLVIEDKVVKTCHGAFCSWCRTHTGLIFTGEAIRDVLFTTGPSPAAHWGRMQRIIWCHYEHAWRAAIPGWIRGVTDRNPPRVAEVDKYGGQAILSNGIPVITPMPLDTAIMHIRQLVHDRCEAAHKNISEFKGIILQQDDRNAQELGPLMEEMMRITQTFADEQDMLYLNYNFARGANSEQLRRLASAHKTQTPIMTKFVAILGAMSVLAKGQYVAFFDSDSVPLRQDSLEYGLACAQGLTDRAVTPGQADNPLVNPSEGHSPTDPRYAGADRYGQVTVGCMAQDPAGPNAGNMFFIQNSPQTPINVPGQPFYKRGAEEVSVCDWLKTLKQDLHLPSDLLPSRSGAWGLVADIESVAGFNVPEEGKTEPGFILAQGRFHDSQGLLLMTIIACTITCILTHTGKQAAFEPAAAYRQFCSDSAIGDLFDSIKHQLRWGKDTFEQGLLFILGTYCAAAGVTPLRMMPNHAGMYNTGQPRGLARDINIEPELVKRLSSPLEEIHSIIGVVAAVSIYETSLQGPTADLSTWRVTAVDMTSLIIDQSSACNAGLVMRHQGKWTALQLIVDAITAKSPAVDWNANSWDSILASSLTLGTEHNIAACIRCPKGDRATAGGREVILVDGLIIAMACCVATMLDYTKAANTMVTLTIASDPSEQFLPEFLIGSRGSVFAACTHFDSLKKVQHALTEGNDSQFCPGSLGISFTHSKSKDAESLLHSGKIHQEQTGDTVQHQWFMNKSVIPVLFALPTGTRYSALRNAIVGTTDTIDWGSSMNGAFLHAFGGHKSQAAKLINGIQDGTHSQLDLAGITRQSPIQLAAVTIKMAEAKPVLIGQSEHVEIFLIIKGFKKLVVLAKGLTRWGAIPPYGDGYDRCVTIILVPHSLQGGGHDAKDKPHVLNNERHVILARILADSRLNAAANKLITGIDCTNPSFKVSAQIHGAFSLPHETPLAEHITSDIHMHIAGVIISLTQAHQLGAPVKPVYVGISAGAAITAHLIATHWRFHHNFAQFGAPSAVPCAWFCIGGCFNPQLLAEIRSQSGRSNLPQLRWTDQHQYVPNMSYSTGGPTDAASVAAFNRALQGRLGVLHCFINAPQDTMCPVHSSFGTDLATAQDGVNAMLDKGGHSAVCSTFSSVQFGVLIDHFVQWDVKLCNGHALSDLPHADIFGTTIRLGHAVTIKRAAIVAAQIQDSSRLVMAHLTDVFRHADWWLSQIQIECMDAETLAVIVGTFKSGPAATAPTAAGNTELMEDKFAICGCMLVTLPAATGLRARDAIFSKSQRDLLVHTILAQAHAMAKAKTEPLASQMLNAPLDFNKWTEHAATFTDKMNQVLQTCSQINNSSDRDVTFSFNGEGDTASCSGLLVFELLRLTFMAIINDGDIDQHKVVQVFQAASLIPQRLASPFITLTVSAPSASESVECADIAGDMTQHGCAAYDNTLYISGTKQISSDLFAIQASIDNDDHKGYTLLSQISHQGRQKRTQVFTTHAVLMPKGAVSPGPHDKRPTDPNMFQTDKLLLASVWNEEVGLTTIGLFAVECRADKSYIFLTGRKGAKLLGGLDDHGLPVLTVTPSAQITLRHIIWTSKLWILDQIGSCERASWLSDPLFYAWSNLHPHMQIRQETQSTFPVADTDLINRAHIALMVVSNIRESRWTTEHAGRGQGPPNPSSHTRNSTVVKVFKSMGLWHPEGTNDHSIIKSLKKIHSLIMDPTATVLAIALFLLQCAREGRKFVLATGGPGKGKTHCHMLVLVLGCLGASGDCDKCVFIAKNGNAVANLCFFLGTLFAKGSAAALSTVFIPSNNLQNRTDIPFAHTGADKWECMATAMFGIVSAGTVQSTPDWKIPRRQGDSMMDEVQDIGPTYSVSIGATIAHGCSRNVQAGDNNQLSHNLSPFRTDLVLEMLETAIPVGGSNVEGRACSAPIECILNASLTDVLELGGEGFLAFYKAQTGEDLLENLQYRASNHARIRDAWSAYVLGASSPLRVPTPEGHIPTIISWLQTIAAHTLLDGSSPDSLPPRVNNEQALGITNAAATSAFLQRRIGPILAMLSTFFRDSPLDVLANSDVANEFGTTGGPQGGGLICIHAPEGELGKDGMFLRGGSEVATHDGTIDWQTMIINAVITAMGTVHRPKLKSAILVINLYKSANKLLQARLHGRHCPNPKSKHTDFYKQEPNGNWVNIPPDELENYLEPLIGLTPLEIDEFLSRHSYHIMGSRDKWGYLGSCLEFTTLGSALATEAEIGICFLSSRTNFLGQARCRAIAAATARAKDVMFIVADFKLMAVSNIPKIRAFAHSVIGTGLVIDAKKEGFLHIQQGAEELATAAITKVHQASSAFSPNTWARNTAGIISDVANRVRIRFQLPAGLSEGTHDLRRWLDTVPFCNINNNLTAWPTKGIEAEGRLRGARDMDSLDFSQGIIRLSLARDAAIKIRNVAAHNAQALLDPSHARHMIALSAAENDVTCFQGNQGSASLLASRLFCHLHMDGRYAHTNQAQLLANWKTIRDFAHNMLHGATPRGLPNQKICYHCKQQVGNGPTWRMADFSQGLAKFVCVNCTTVNPADIPFSTINMRSMEILVALSQGDSRRQCPKPPVEHPATVVTVGQYLEWLGTQAPQGDIPAAVDMERLPITQDMDLDRPEAPGQSVAATWSPRDIGNLDENPMGTQDADVVLRSKIPVWDRALNVQVLNNECIYRAAAYVLKQALRSEQEKRHCGPGASGVSTSLLTLLDRSTCAASILISLATRGGLTWQIMRQEAKQEKVLVHKWLSSAPLTADLTPPTSAADSIFKAGRSLAQAPRAPSKYWENDEDEWTRSWLTVAGLATRIRLGAHVQCTAGSPWENPLQKRNLKMLVPRIMGIAIIRGARLSDDSPQDYQGPTVRGPEIHVDDTHAQPTYAALATPVSAVDHMRSRIMLDSCASFTVRQGILGMLKGNIQQIIQDIVQEANSMGCAQFCVRDSAASCLALCCARAFTGDLLTKTELKGIIEVFSIYRTRLQTRSYHPGLQQGLRQENKRHNLYPEARITVRESSEAAQIKACLVGLFSRKALLEHSRGQVMAIIQGKLNCYHKTILKLKDTNRGGKWKTDPSVCRRAHVTYGSGMEELNFRRLVEFLERETPHDNERGARAAFWAKIVETESAISEATAELHNLANASVETLLDTIDATRSHKNRLRPAYGNSKTDESAKLTGQTISIHIYMNGPGSEGIALKIPEGYSAQDVVMAIETLCDAVPGRDKLALQFTTRWERWSSFEAKCAAGAPLPPPDKSTDDWQTTASGTQSVPVMLDANASLLIQGYDDRLRAEPVNQIEEYITQAANREHDALGTVNYEHVARVTKADLYSARQPEHTDAAAALIHCRWFVMEEAQRLLIVGQVHEVYWEPILGAITATISAGGQVNWDQPLTYYLKEGVLSRDERRIEEWPISEPQARRELIMKCINDGRIEPLTHDWLEETMIHITDARLVELAGKHFLDVKLYVTRLANILNDVTVSLLTCPLPAHLIKHTVTVMRMHDDEVSNVFSRHLIRNPAPATHQPQGSAERTNSARAPRTARKRHKGTLAPADPTEQHPPAHSATTDISARQDHDDQWERQPEPLQVGNYSASSSSNATHWVGTATRPSHDAPTGKGGSPGGTQRCSQASSSDTGDTRDRPGGKRGRIDSQAPPWRHQEQTHYGWYGYDTTRSVRGKQQGHHDYWQHRRG